MKDWPLTQSQPEIKDFDKCRQELLDIIDVRRGLLDKLFSKNCLSEREMKKFEAGHEDANKRLLKMIRRKSVADYDTLLACLLETNQPVVVSLIAPHHEGGRPRLS